MQQRSLTTLDLKPDRGEPPAKTTVVGNGHASISAQPQSTLALPDFPTHLHEHKGQLGYSCIAIKLTFRQLGSHACQSAGQIVEKLRRRQGSALVHRRRSMFHSTRSQQDVLATREHSRSAEPCGACEASLERSAKVASFHMRGELTCNSSGEERAANSERISHPSVLLYRDEGYLCRAAMNASALECGEQRGERGSQVP